MRLFSFKHRFAVVFGSFGVSVEDFVYMFAKVVTASFQHKIVVLVGKGMLFKMLIYIIKVVVSGPIKSKMLDDPMYLHD